MTPSGTITDYPLPAGREAYGITTGPDGNIWFGSSHGIGRLSLGGAAPLHASASGRVYEDVNINGQQDAVEPGINGRTVYFDSNGNHHPDSYEPSAVTANVGGQDGIWQDTGTRSGRRRRRGDSHGAALRRALLAAAEPRP